MPDNISNAKLVDEFIANGGQVRKMPMGATASRPSSMPRSDRDALIESRRKFSTASRRNYLTVEKIHEVEAMIDRRASREEIADAVDRDPADLFALVEKLEHSGIAYPNYLRQPMESPFEVLRHFPTDRSKGLKPKPIRQSLLRALTKEELIAIDRVRTGINAKSEVKNLSVAYDTFTKLIAMRFGCVAGLRKFKSNEAMLDHLALLPTRGTI